MMNKGVIISIIVVFCALCTSKIQAQYPFIRHDLNQIILPADSSEWFDLAKKIKSAKNGGRLKILHFGDSHIQADYFTGQVRKHLLGYIKAENCSRGVTMPYRALGTNGPDELFATKEGNFEITSVRKNMPDIFAFSGYCISAVEATSSISLNDTSGYRFNKVSIFHSPLVLQTITVNGVIARTNMALTDSLHVSTFILPQLQQRIKLEFTNASVLNKIRIYAFSLENNDCNLQYSSIGINGATFGTFLNLYGTQEILKFLDPDCIVFSYGTNDALHKLDSTLIKFQMISCLNRVKTALPNIPVIFTTPGDHLINNKKTLNPRVPFAAMLIKETATANNCGAWDFFNVMGGRGSVRDWYSNQLVFKDGIHLSKKGYKYQGDLFFDAFIKLKDLKN